MRLSQADGPRARQNPTRDLCRTSFFGLFSILSGYFLRISANKKPPQREFCERFEDRYEQWVRKREVDSAAKVIAFFGLN